MIKNTNKINRSAGVLILFIGLVTSCTLKNETTMANAATNKAFILEMIGQKKTLKDYPGKAKPDMIVHEPSSLPFGGTYKGLDAYEQFYPKVRTFYDFSKFELQHVYADGDAVFALIKAAIANTGSEILLCEHFRFEDGQIAEVRLYLYDFPGKPIHQLVK